MTVSSYVKDPNAIRDFAVDWALDAGDTITVSTWAAAVANFDTVMAIGISSFTTSPNPHRTVVRLSGGTLTKEYLFINHITTAQGKQEDHTLIILCLEE